MLRSRSLALIGAAAAASLLSCALAAGTPAAAAGPAGPARASLARPGLAAALMSGSDHALYGDSCPDASFCMAVGNYDLGGRATGLSEVLQAGKWVVKHVPSPPLGANVFASGVSCSSATSCLLVGAHWAGRHGLNANLAEAWNGSSWHVVSAPRPAGTFFSSLNDVACPTADFCLVIGAAGTTARHYHDTAYTWTNNTWRQISVPRPNRSRNSELAGLACSDAALCMAVGDYTNTAGRLDPFAARWDNGRWRLLHPDFAPGQYETTLQAASCPTANRCVVVGNTVDNTRGRYYHAFAEFWISGNWYLGPVRPAPSVFLGVSCPAAVKCFASGYTFPSVRGYAHQLIETWSGTGESWTAQRPAQTSGLGGGLPQVSCVSAVLCEAVGYAFRPGAPNRDRAISELWNGHHWTGQVTPNP